ncbi:MAG: hypothetical protein ACETWM_07775 [Candidatus Lokiarchaeia archaeon]
MVLATLLKLLASAFGKGANTGANVVTASKVTSMDKKLDKLDKIDKIDKTLKLIAKKLGATEKELKEIE